jgi:HK97 family phage major capsid protein
MPLTELLQKQEERPSTLAKTLLGSTEWKEFTLSRRRTVIDLPEIKAAGDPIAGLATYSFVPPIIHAVPPAGVLDLITRASSPTSSLIYSTATYPLTNASAFVAEGGLKPENQPRWTSATCILQEVANWCSVTRLALDDITSLERTIDVDLQNLLNDRIADRVINGTGTSPDLLGILATPNIQTVAFVTTSSILDMIFKGINAVQSLGYGTVNGIVLNPADALSMVTTRTTNVYLLSPTLPPIATDAHCPVGTAIVADWRYATLYDRGGIRIVVDYLNDDILKNKLTLAASQRVGLALSRPQAFAKVALA